MDLLALLFMLYLTGVMITFISSVLYFFIRIVTTKGGCIKSISPLLAKLSYTKEFSLMSVILQLSLLSVIGFVRLAKYT